MKLSAFALLIIMLLSSCSKTIQTISPTAEPSETETPEIVETQTPIESGIPETTPTPSPNVTPTPTVKPPPTPIHTLEPTPTNSNLVSADKAKNEIKEGMTYEEVVEILGMEGYDVTNWEYEFQWDLDNGKFLYITFGDDTTVGAKAPDPLNNPGFNFSRQYKVVRISIHDTNYKEYYIQVVWDWSSYEFMSKIEKGMTYQDVVDIIGYEGLDVGSGIYLYRWDLHDGNYLYIWVWNEKEGVAAMRITQGKYESHI